MTPSAEARGVHVTVLKDEAVAALLAPPTPGFDAPDRAGGRFVDGTYGRGGHTRALLAALGDAATLIAYDKDPHAIADAQALAAIDARVRVVHASFASLRETLPAKAANDARLDGVLLDLGVSSPQFDDVARGFSFRGDAPLDMRMDFTRGATAADFLAEAPLRRILEVLRDYGEERFAAPIAKALVARREDGRPVRTTGELAALVAAHVKTREPGKDPATRTFQALRILVNRELEDLEEGLNAALAQLKPGARLVVISFHSLEDRCVKRFIARESRTAFDRRVPFADVAPPRLRAVARVMPGAAEVAANPRARSAVLRVAERTDAPLDARGAQQVAA